MNEPETALDVSTVVDDPSLTGGAPAVDIRRWSFVVSSPFGTLLVALSSVWVRGRRGTPDGAFYVAAGLVGGLVALSR